MPDSRNEEPSPAPNASPSGVSKARLEAFSDGVLAIAITLLVLELKVPEHLGHGAFVAALWAQGPRLGAYVLTFFSTGVFWVAHHLLLQATARIDRAVLWINNGFLMSVALLPFSASVLGNYPLEPSAVALYGSNLVLVDGTLLWLWHHCARHLLRPEVPSAFVRTAYRRFGAAVGLYLFATLLSLAGTMARGLALALFWLVPLSYVFLQTIVDRRAGRS